MKKTKFIEIDKEVLNNNKVFFVCSLYGSCGHNIFYSLLDNHNDLYTFPLELKTIPIECDKFEDYTLNEHVSALMNNEIIFDTSKSNKKNNPIVVTSLGRKRYLELGKKFKSSSIYYNVTENPTFKDCNKAISFCENKAFDGVIAIGGGSVMDLAKVIMAYISSNENDIYELINIQNGYGEKTPAIFLPTTHGTGSEVTMWGTIWNMEEKKKYSISHLSLYPDIAILDPILVLTLPLNTSIITLMDALSHSFESIWNVNSNPVSTTLAIEAISIILQNVNDFKKNPSDKLIRDRLLNASNKAGLAFSNTKTAAAHSISYPLTIHYGIPHGIASSITILELLKINKKSIEPALDSINNKNMISFNGLISKIKSIPQGIVPFTLSGWGVKKKDFNFIIDRSFTKERMENNIVKLSKNDISNIIHNIY